MTKLSKLPSPAGSPPASIKGLVYVQNECRVHGTSEKKCSARAVAKLYASPVLRRCNLLDVDDNNCYKQARSYIRRGYSEAKEVSTAAIGRRQAGTRGMRTFVGIMPLNLKEGE